MSDDEIDEEESISNYFCFVLPNLWNERETHINNDYADTGCMLCVINHIR